MQSSTKACWPLSQTLPLVCLRIAVRISVRLPLPLKEPKGCFLSETVFDQGLEERTHGFASSSSDCASNPSQST